MFYISDALYKWLTSGSNAGVTGNVGVGPFKAAGSAGFGAVPVGEHVGAFVGAPVEEDAGGK